MAIDLLRKHHLRLARLSPATLDRINAFTSAWQRIGNPADIWPAFAIAGHPLDEVFTTVLDSLLQDEDVHAVMLLLPTMQAEQKAKVLEIIERGGEKPILRWPDTPEVEQPGAALEKTGRIAVFSSVDRALRALSHLHGRWSYLSIDGDRT
jgi:acyl-CoA synthetase (NDP forming)